MFIDVPDAKLFATRGGPADAPVILAIGGWIGSSELWLEPLGLLSDAYSTLSYDHRGSGLSECRVDSITMDNLVSDALAVLDVHGIEQCVVAAESAGALTALSLAITAPERVSHLVIVDGMYDRGIPPEGDAFLQGLRTHYDATIERFVQLCVPEPDAEHIKAWGRKILNRAEPAAAIALRLVGSSADVVSDLGAVTQPTLVIHGSLDQIVPLAKARELVERLADAELCVIDGTGHVPTLTQPVAVAAVIREFLGRRITGPSGRTPPPTR